MKFEDFAYLVSDIIMQHTGLSTIVLFGRDNDTECTVKLDGKTTSCNLQIEITSNILHYWFNNSAQLIFEHHDKETSSQYLWDFIIKPHLKLELLPLLGGAL